MKPAPAKAHTKIVIIESDPLRLVGFRALFDSEPDFDLISASVPEITRYPEATVALLAGRNGENLFDMIASLKAARPDLRVLVTGALNEDETILKALAAGAKGYVDETASPATARSGRRGACFPLLLTV